MDTELDRKGRSLNGRGYYRFVSISLGMIIGVVAAAILLVGILWARLVPDEADVSLTFERYLTDSSGRRTAALILSNNAPYEISVLYPHRWGVDAELLDAKPRWPWPEGKRKAVANPHVPPLHRLRFYVEAPYHHYPLSVTWSKMPTGVDKVIGRGVELLERVWPGGFDLEAPHRRLHTVEEPIPRP